MTDTTGQSDDDAMLAAAQAERDEYEAQARAATKKFDAAVNAAQDAVENAKDACEELGHADFDFFETTAGGCDDAASGLQAARRALSGVREISGALLRDVTDAEKDEELSRLRARVADLESRILVPSYSVFPWDAPRVRVTLACGCTPLAAEGTAPAAGGRDNCPAHGWADVTDVVTAPVIDYASTAYLSCGDMLAGVQADPGPVDCPRHGRVTVAIPQSYAAAAATLADAVRRDLGDGAQSGGEGDDRD